jgi:hypothetical protein
VDDALGAGALSVGDGVAVEGFVLAGAAELDWAGTAAGLLALRSSSISTAAIGIPMPRRATMATAAAMTRLRRGPVER